MIYEHVNKGYQYSSPLGERIKVRGVSFPLPLGERIKVRGRRLDQRKKIKVRESVNDWGNL